MSIIGRVLYWLVPAMLVGTLVVLSGMLVASNPTAPWTIGIAGNTVVLVVGLIIALFTNINNKR